MVRPLHDISQPGTVILNEEQWQRGAGKLEDGRPVVPVSIDPYLSRLLRPHQVGVVHNLDKIEACSIFKLQKVVAVPCSRDKECSLQKLHQD